MFNWIAGAYNWIAGKIDNQVRAWVHDIATALYGFFHAVFGDIIAGWDYLYREALKIGSELPKFFDAVTREILYLWRVWIPNLWKWIYAHIIGPLADAWKWISHEGATLWYYITHPDKLAELLYSYLVQQLEARAWETGKLLGTFFLSLIVRNLGKVAVLIEDILNAVF